MTYKVDNSETPISLNEPEEIRNILQNIRMILRTPKGSVPCYRDFGLDWSFLDRPTTVAEVLVIPAVREAVEQWEPRVTVLGTRLTGTTINGIATIETEVESNG